MSWRRIARVRLQRCYTEFGVYDDEDGIFDNPLIQGLQYGFRQAMQPWRDRNLGLGRESYTDPGSTSSSLLPSPGFDYQNLGIKYIVKDAAEWKHLGKQFGKRDSTTLIADLHEGATPATPQIGRRWRQPASQEGPQIKPHFSFEQVSVETMKGMRLCFNTTSTLETVMMLINWKYPLNEK
jgi:hypothetical protein